MLHIIARQFLGTDTDFGPFPILHGHPSRARLACRIGAAAEAVTSFTIYSKHKRALNGNNESLAPKFKMGTDYHTATLESTRINNFCFRASKVPLFRLKPPYLPPKFWLALNYCKGPLQCQDSQESPALHWGICREIFNKSGRATPQIGSFYEMLLLVFCISSNGTSWIVHVCVRERQRERQREFKKNKKHCRITFQMPFQSMSKTDWLASDRGDILQWHLSSAAAFFRFQNVILPKKVFLYDVLM